MGVNCSIQTETCGLMCTDWNGILKNGKNGWNAIDEVLDEIPCKSCKAHSKQRMSFEHDVVNVGLGEKPYDEKNMRSMLQESICVYNTCVVSGRCEGPAM